MCDDSINYIYMAKMLSVIFATGHVWMDISETAILRSASPQLHLHHCTTEVSLFRASYQHNNSSPNKQHKKADINHLLI